MASMKMLPPGKETDTDIKWEDQAKINRFSQLNTKMDQLEDLYEQKKQEKEYLDDLTQELELCDEDDPVKYKMGDTYVTLPYSAASEYIESDVTNINDELNNIKSKMDTAKAEMNKLKVDLYATFGGAINLERE
ncbi:Prefoldin subunit-domain-containing protein [Paraphysoderma sedebokerense]|nr:Prefoldin subunit-domain-containing protein [Paraphysoderma sedebokerense]